MERAETAPIWSTASSEDRGNNGSLETKRTAVEEELPPASAIYDMPTAELISLGKRLQKLLSSPASEDSREARESRRHLLRSLALELRERHTSLCMRNSLQSLTPAPTKQEGEAEEATLSTSALHTGTRISQRVDTPEGAHKAEEEDSKRRCQSHQRSEQTRQLAEKQESVQKQLLLPLLLQKRQALKKLGSQKTCKTDSGLSRKRSVNLRSFDATPRSSTQAASVKTFLKKGTARKKNGESRAELAGGGGRRGGGGGTAFSESDLRRASRAKSKDEKSGVPRTVASQRPENLLRGDSSVEGKSAGSAAPRQPLVVQSGGDSFRCAEETLFSFKKKEQGNPSTQSERLNPRSVPISRLTSLSKEALQREAAECLREPAASRGEMCFSSERRAASETSWRSDFPTAGNRSIALLKRVRAAKSRECRTDTSDRNVGVLNPTSLTQTGRQQERGAREAHASIRCCAQSMVGSLQETLAELSRRAALDQQGGGSRQRKSRLALFTAERSVSRCFSSQRRSSATFISLRRWLTTDPGAPFSQSEERRSHRSNVAPPLSHLSSRLPHLSPPRPSSPNTELRLLLKEVCGDIFDETAAIASPVETANSEEACFQGERNADCFASSGLASEEGASLETVYAILQSISEIPGIAGFHQRPSCEENDREKNLHIAKSCADTPLQTEDVLNGGSSTPPTGGEVLHSSSEDKNALCSTGAAAEWIFLGKSRRRLCSQRPLRERPNTADPPPRPKAAILVPFHLDAPLTLSRRQVLRRLRLVRGRRHCALQENANNAPPFDVSGKSTLENGEFHFEQKNDSPHEDSEAEDPPKDALNHGRHFLPRSSSLHAAQTATQTEAEVEATSEVETQTEAEVEAEADIQKESRIDEWLPIREVQGGDPPTQGSSEASAVSEALEAKGSTSRASFNESGTDQRSIPQNGILSLRRLSQREAKKDESSSAIVHGGSRLRQSTSACSLLKGVAESSSNESSSTEEEEGPGLTRLLRLVTREASFEGLVLLRQLAQLLQHSKRELFFASQKQRVAEDGDIPLRTFSCENCDCEEEATLAEALHGSGGWVLVRGRAAAKTCNLRWIGKRGNKQELALLREKTQDSVSTNNSIGKISDQGEATGEKAGRCRLPFFLQMCNRMHGVENAFDLRRVFRLQRRLASAAGGTLQRLFEVVPPTFSVPLKRKQLLEETALGVERRGSEPLWLRKGQKGAFWESPATAQRILLNNFGGQRSESSHSTLLQQYIDEPLLLRKRKFSLKLFVVLTACKPLEAFVYQEGVCYVARLPFSMKGDALTNPFVHRTNCLPSTFVGAARDVLPGFTRPRPSAEEAKPERERRGVDSASVGVEGSCSGDGNAEEELETASRDVSTLSLRTQCRREEDAATHHHQPQTSKKGKNSELPRNSQINSQQKEEGKFLSTNDDREAVGIRLTFQQLREMLLLEETPVAFERLWKSACTAVLQVLLLAAPQLRASSPGFAVLAFSVVFDKHGFAKVTKVECDARIEGSRRQRKAFLQSLIALVNPQAFSRTELAEAILAALPEGLLRRASVATGGFSRSFLSSPPPNSADSALRTSASLHAFRVERTFKRGAYDKERVQAFRTLERRGRGIVGGDRDEKQKRRFWEVRPNAELVGKTVFELSSAASSQEELTAIPSLMRILDDLHEPGVAHRLRNQGLPKAFDENATSACHYPLHSKAGEPDLPQKEREIHFERLAPSKSSVRLQNIAAQAGVSIG